MLHVTMATIGVLSAQAAVMCFNIETIIHKSFIVHTGTPLS